MSRIAERFERRIEHKGPRYAAYVIVAVWTIGVVVFGVVERLVDPKTASRLRRRSSEWKPPPIECKGAVSAELSLSRST